MLKILINLDFYYFSGVYQIILGKNDLNDHGRRTCRGPCYQVSRAFGASDGVTKRIFYGSGRNG